MSIELPCLHLVTARKVGAVIDEAAYEDYIGTISRSSSGCLAICGLGVFRQAGDPPLLEEWEPP